MILDIGFAMKLCSFKLKGLFHKPTFLWKGGLWIINKPLIIDIAV